MALATLFALALMAADPADGPVGTAPAEVDAARERAASVRPERAPDPSAPMGTALPVRDPKQSPAKLDRAAADRESPPPGAPADDYGLVAWCYGALQGHMALFDMVKPQLDALPDPDPKATAGADEEMMAAGRQYLELYTRALRAAEKGDPEAAKVPAAQTMETGRGIWDKAKAADPKTRMWSWAMWTLPGKCELAAERLYERSMLAGQRRGVNMRTDPVPPPKAD